MVEAVFFENCHYTAVLHFAVLDNKVEAQLPEGFRFTYVLEAVLGNYFGDGKECAGIQPARYVVVRRVVEQGFVGNAEDMLLHVLEIADAHYLPAVARVADYEISEAEVAHYSVAKVD